MRFRFRTLILMFLVGAVAGLSIDFLRARGQPNALTSAPPLTELALDNVVPEVWLDRVPAGVAAEKISAATGIPIELDRKALAEGGIAESKPVTIRLRNAKLCVVLDELANQACAETTTVVWTVDNDRVRLTTSAHDADAVTRVYDVGDVLAAAVPAVIDAGPVAPNSSGCRFCWVPTSKLSTAEQAQADLQRVFIETIAPDSWRDNGGNLGSIKFLGNHLILTQSVRNHRMVRQLLHEVRSGRTEPPSQPPTASPQLIRWRQEVKQWVPADTDINESALRKQLPEFRVEEQNFTAAVADIAKAWNVPIAIDPQIAEPARRAWPISFSLRNATGFDALKALVAAAKSAKIFAGENNATQQLPPLDWTIDEGLVRILSEVELAPQRFVTRAYDLRDWFTSAMADNRDREAFSEQIVRVVQDTIAPDSWREAGGSYGSIRELNRFVIVTQTYQNQEEVRRFLDDLHRALKRKPGGNPTTALTRP